MITARRIGTTVSKGVIFTFDFIQTTDYQYDRAGKLQIYNFIQGKFGRRTDFTVADWCFLFFGGMVFGKMHNLYYSDSFLLRIEQSGSLQKVLFHSESVDSADIVRPRGQLIFFLGKIPEHVISFVTEVSEGRFFTEMPRRFLKIDILFFSRNTHHFQLMNDLWCLIEHCNCGFLFF
jgi:hypothetical protein